ncbi:MAG: deoxyhypusine synthase family protein [Cyanobacteria bacterium P01_H01_bin.130]
MSDTFGRRITPQPISQSVSVVDLVDQYFAAYNGARLREICQLLTQDVMADGVTVGLGLSGAMTPAGFGSSLLAPLIRHGLIDYIVSTGANLYHDLHYGLGLDLYAGQPNLDDVKLRQDGKIRIYDIVFDYSVLLETDRFIRELLWSEPFQKTMGTAEFYFLLGRYIREVEQTLGIQHPCLLTTAYECGVPIYTPAPGDSSLGMNLAALALDGSKLVLDPALDVNETTAIVYCARENHGQKNHGQEEKHLQENDAQADVAPEDRAPSGKSAVFILGGGTPKNFLLQTQPHIHEILRLPEKGHDYFIQVTDARPDTGGLSGATPSEAVSWGKVDPDKLPSSLVCYTDSAIALPLITAYVLQQSPARPLKRLYDQRQAMADKLHLAYQSSRAAQNAHQQSARKNARKTDRTPAMPEAMAERTPTYPCGTPIRQPHKR